ncbi:MAG: glycoside hydrolase family 127 protein [Saprospiraceae bacterium]|nr:glycoside hydrolase family 127 protein [Saprospiraceae bacterium]
MQLGMPVRATYLYTAMADLSLETKRNKYLPALDSIWNDIVCKKMYITGGIGTRQFHDEDLDQLTCFPMSRHIAKPAPVLGLLSGTEG